MSKKLAATSFVCNTRTGWETLKRVDHFQCFLIQLGDIHPFYPGPVINCPMVVIDRCDKNFVYYWLNRETFPYMKRLVLGSHPCEPKVIAFLEEEAKNGTQIYIKEHWERYVIRWGYNPTNIKIISNDIYERTFPFELRHKD